MSTAVPTLEECHVTAGKLIALQSRRLVELAEFMRRVRIAVDPKETVTDATRIEAIRVLLAEANKQ